MLVTSDGRSQYSFSVLPPCCWHCSLTSCRSALSCSGPLFRSSYRPSTCSGSSCEVLMALRGLLVGLHSLPPVRMASTRGTRPSRLSARPRYCGNRRPVPLLGHSPRAAPGALSALTPRLPVVGAPCGCRPEVWADQAAAPPN